jgi:hypothetical protein
LAIGNKQGIGPEAKGRFRFELAIVGRRKLRKFRDCITFTIQKLVPGGRSLLGSLCYRQSRDEYTK